jgi:hypothetical protein
VSWRTTGILFLVLLIAGAAVLALQQRYSAEAQATPTAASSSFVEVVDLFDGVLVEDVVRLEIIQTEPEDAAVFSREEDSSWVQAVPTTTLVFSPTLTNQVTGLLNTRARRSFSAGGGDLAPYGLDNPQATIVLAVRREGETVRYELALGSRTPTGDAYYVQRRGDPRVHLLSTAALDGVLGLLEHVPLPQPEGGEP